MCQSTPKCNLLAPSEIAGRVNIRVRGILSIRAQSVRFRTVTHLRGEGSRGTREQGANV